MNAHTLKESSPKNVNTGLKQCFWNVHTLLKTKLLECLYYKLKRCFWNVHTLLKQCFWNVHSLAKQTLFSSIWWCPSPNWNHNYEVMRKPHRSTHFCIQSSGYYIYIETSSHNANSSARIRSPAFSTSSDTCVTFWYHMYGSHVNRLDMYVVAATSQQGKLMWTKSGNQGFKWLQAQVDIGTVTNAQVVENYIIAWCYGIMRPWAFV